MELINKSSPGSNIYSSGQQGLSPRLALFAVTQFAGRNPELVINNRLSTNPRMTATLARKKSSSPVALASQALNSDLHPSTQYLPRACPTRDKVAAARDLFIFLGRETLLLMWMLHELFCLIADPVPAWLFFDKLMKSVGKVEFIVKTVRCDGK